MITPVAGSVACSHSAVAPSSSAPSAIRSSATSSTLPGSHFGHAPREARWSTGAKPRPPGAEST
eukprot:5542732-Prymnesium_polylepis.1